MDNAVFTSYNELVKKNIWILGALVVLAALLVLLRPQYGWRIRSFLAPDFGGKSDVGALALENEALKVELAKLKNIKSQLPQRPANFLRAVVLSRYPMNFKNEFLIDAGVRDGVSLGKAVTFGGVLVGEVGEVFERTSLVRTIFDDDFQLAVRIGVFGVDALFTGGTLPKATLIPQPARLKEGDIVYSASPNFPYGLAVGEVADIESSADQLFQEATLNFVYDIGGIKTVLVSK